MSLISVIIPCYNAGEYLSSAVESVINQTHRDIEIIAIDDCSTDETLKTLQSFAEKDDRLKVVRNAENLGLIRTLNKGIDLAHGEFIARMDHDDICLPQRLERQLAEFRQDETLELVSCRWIVINEKGRALHKNLPRTFTTKSNLFESFFGPPFGHPTVMMRTATVKKYYYRFTETTKHIEDYDLWSRMLLGGIKTRVMNEVLMKYRSFSENTTHKFHHIQSQNMIFNAVENLRNFLDIELPDNVKKLVFNRQETNVSKFELAESIAQFKIIKRKFTEKMQPNAEELKEINHLAANHISDIVIQYLLKNENPSFSAAADIFRKNFFLLMSFKNLYYIFSKLFVLFLRLLHNKS